MIVKKDKGEFTVSLFRKKSSKELRLPYEREKDPIGFRYKTLKAYSNSKLCILSLDSNLMRELENLHAFMKDLIKELECRQIPFVQQRIPSNKKASIFGLAMSNQKQALAYRIICQLYIEDIDEKFFAEFLSYFDLIIGINPQHSFEHICNELEETYTITFPESDEYEGYLYDSMNFSIIRTGKNFNK